MRFCLSTVTSGCFQHYLPILAYTVRKNVPNVYVKTFHRGGIDDITLEAFEIIHRAGITVDLPIEAFKEYPFNDYTTNCVRFLVPHSYFEGMDYVYMTDADFIYLLHEPSIDEYYSKKLQLWAQCWWGRRGPRRDRKTKEVDRRVAGGGVLWDLEWWERTQIQRAVAVRRVMSGEYGKVREDDERMLWNIVAGSGLKCPDSMSCTRPKKYKEIHLGDFKDSFNRWRSMSNMKKRICRGNYLKFFRLEEDPVWQKLVEVCCKDSTVSETISNLRTYMNKRKSHDMR